MRELKVPYVGFPPSATEVSGYCGSIRSHAATLNKDYQVTVWPGYFLDTSEAFWQDAYLKLTDLIWFSSYSAVVNRK